MEREDNKKGALPKSEVVKLLKHFYGMLTETEDIQVDIYVVESTGKTVKDVDRWHNVYQLKLNSDERYRVLKKFKDKYKILLRALSGDDVDVAHLYDYTASDSKTLRLIEPENVVAFQSILRKITTESFISSSYRKIKRLSGFVIDILLSNGERIQFIVKGQKKVVLKQNSFMFGLVKKDVKIADDDYAAIQVTIDAIYVDTDDNKLLIVKNTGKFEQLFRFYEHYKQAAEEIISELKELEIIEFENESKTMKEFFKYPTLSKRLFQLKENGVFDFFDDDGNLTDNYYRFERKVKDARKMLDDARFDVVEDQTPIKVRILDKKGLSQFITVCQGRIILFSEVGEDALQIGEVKGTVKPVKTIAEHGAQTLIQTVLDKWVSPKPKGKSASK
ncbi:Kiwa anti-phage protein KwaB-like domain-containing protein [Thermococcus sp. GR6]|uniref:Kiwa anti-phage protein KwaB-like domain-containing protein n=1 Tax=Thermococcus sp. GR6 TaxID=1638256 RepID=UPI00142F6C7E|nr:Kiwa anti-phage protein KwaB-like domain-containing protein [Thermococcus sp. GR6]NJE41835.1 DUF4868 domain-containing protein [Thermococcus sp. GR6]